MNNVQKEIDGAYAALAAIPVAGDLVERMAIARDHLRRAYALAEVRANPKEKKGVIADWDLNGAPGEVGVSEIEPFTNLKETKKDPKEGVSDGR